jgi:biopolymer transport protein ExbB
MTEFFLDGDGGLLMWPILFVSVVGMAVTIESFFPLNRVRGVNRKMPDKGEFDKPRMVISKYKSTISQMLGMGLARQGVVRRREDAEGVDCVKKS